jgi:hypothetical protein
MKIVFDPAVLGLLEASRLPSSRKRIAPARPDLSVSALLAQLEGEWRSVGCLPAARVRALNQLRDHADGIDPQESRLSYVMGRRNPNEVMIERIEECSLMHAWVATVTVAMIDRAKSAHGILPSSDFHWTRSADPAFWLMINGFGRPRQSPEVAGIFAHHAFELVNGPSRHTHFETCETVFSSPPPR